MSETAGIDYVPVPIPERVEPEVIAPVISIVKPEVEKTPEPEFRTAYQHYLGHGACYRNACVERYGMPMDMSLGRALLRGV